MEIHVAGWVLFNAFVLGMLALDLGLFHRKSHAVSAREAAIWSLVWVAISLAFAGLLYRWQGAEVTGQYLAGYLIEKSLSVDNIFVFVMIFSYFSVPAEYQHRVLFWGILGALVMRGALIGLGATLVSRFEWVLYLFGLFLVLTAVKMVRHQQEEVDPSKNRAVQIVRRLLPITDRYHGQKFFVVEQGRRMATPLLLVLAVVETTDLLFALDSIPAIFAVSTDPFIVYTSNVFAILGLRSLYFLLAGVVRMFRYLKLGLAAILAFVGVKLLIAGFVHIPISVSLSVIGAILAVSIGASLLVRQPAAIPQEE